MSVKNYTLTITSYEEQLKENPLNTYAPLSDDELSELMEDIREKGIIVSLIAKKIGNEMILLCGHNRRRAAARLKLPKVPVQLILSPLTPKLEKEIMHSENDLRRGGSWSKEKKIEFILEHFGEDLSKDNRGGDRKSKTSQDQKFSELLLDDSKNMAKVIEESSKGNITEGTAKRLLSEIKKKKLVRKDKPIVTKASILSELSPKEKIKVTALIKSYQMDTKEIETLKKQIVIKEEKLRKLKVEIKKFGNPNILLN
jgi:ParB-like chromosome segregation protein Spo0J